MFYYNKESVNFLENVTKSGFNDFLTMWYLHIYVIFTGVLDIILTSSCLDALHLFTHATHATSHQISKINILVIVATVTVNCKTDHVMSI